MLTTFAARPTLAGVVALLLWAFLAPLATVTGGLPPLLVTALGLGTGGALGLAFMSRAERRHARRQPPLVWAHGLAGIGGFHALYFAAMSLAPPVEANLLNYAWPLLTVLLAAPLRGLPIGPWRLGGVALGALGTALLLGDAARFPPEATLGFACAIAAALTWATYSVLAGRLPDVPTGSVAWFCLAAGVAAFGAHLAFEPVGVPSLVQLGAMLLLGAGPLGAAFYLWDIGMKRGDPRLLGSLAYAVPVASTLLLLAIGIGEPDMRIAIATLLVAGGGLLAAGAGRIERRHAATVASSAAKAENITSRA